MTKDRILDQLRQHQAELRSAGVEKLSLFGSVARGDDGPDSDVDVVVTLTDEITFSGFGYFGALSRLRERIEEITGRSVDIVSEPIEKESLRRSIERDRTIAF
jgi:predicted nucleotidyltransferase